MSKEEILTIVGDNSSESIGFANGLMQRLAQSPISLTNQQIKNAWERWKTERQQNGVWLCTQQSTSDGP